MDEEPLPGGAITAVTRAGNTVRRTPPPDPAFVHALLRLFERRGWDGAPRFLGTDERGREVLSFLDGHVAWQPAQPPSVTAPTGRPAALASPDGAPCGARVYATGDGGSAGTRASSAAVQLSQ